MRETLGGIVARLFAKKSSFIFLALIAALFSEVTGWFLPVVVISLILSYIIATKILDKSADSRLFVLAIALVLYSAIVQALVMCSWVFYKEIPLAQILTISLFFILFLLLLINGVGRRAIHRKAITKADGFTLAVLLIVVLVVIGVPLYKARSSGEASYYSLINYGVDDSSHIGILNDHIQSNRGVLQSTDFAPLTRSKINIPYPAGWHSMNAAFMLAAYPDLKPGIDSTLFYTISKVMWFIFTTYLLIRTVFAIYLVYLKKKMSTVQYVIASGILLLSSLWVIADFFILGFYSFLPVLFATPLMIFSLLQLFSTRERKLFADALVLPVALICVVVLTWLLVAPVFIASLAVPVVIYMIKNWRTLRLPDVKTFLPAIILALVVVIAIFIQLYLTRSGSGSEPFIQQITMAGGIVIYPFSLYLILGLGIIPFIMLISKSTSKRVVDSILLFSFSSAVFIGIIYFIQQYYIQANAYYFHKSLTLLLVSLVIIFSLGIIAFVPALIEKLGRVNAALTIGMLFIFLAFTVYPSPAIMKFSFAARPVTNNTNRQLMGIMRNEYTLNSFQKKHITLFYPFDNSTLNEVGSTFLKSNRIRSSCYTLLKGYSLPTKIVDFDPTVVNIPECEGYTITIYVDPQYEELAKEKLGPYPKAIVKVINY